VRGLTVPTRNERGIKQFGATSTNRLRFANQ
jgi:hypothetical protein